MSLPRIIYHLEGLIIFIVSVTTYFLMYDSRLMFFVLILAPDIGMLGYLINQKVGSVTYNMLHTYLWPILLGFFGVTMGYPTLPIALIWAAHIGGDRLLGYGLKYPTGFKHVDVQRL